MLTFPTIHTLPLDESTPTAPTLSRYKLPAAPDCIPTELLLTIGQYLNKPSALVSLRVSQRWSTALQFFLWFTIFAKHWHHPEFPINQQQQLSTTVSPTVTSVSTNSSSLASCLVRVRALTWLSNLQMATFYRTPLLPEIPLDKLARKDLGFVLRVMSR
ncbi:hypothetical protein BG015_011410 [Linnemannia schmuckeri]|uniref:F-box domain-containing protein n=1 Tax=Linnemannia schmuckeri TaxID=64567 RepID=A0A9P5RVE6_9FUNG|nr:hypothetical protein BG015_011410 [Linnemannia schmuckeri]